MILCNFLGSFIYSRPHFVRIFKCLPTCPEVFASGVFHEIVHGFDLGLVEWHEQCGFLSEKVVSFHGVILISIDLKNSELYYFCVPKTYSPTHLKSKPVIKSKLRVQVSHFIFPEKNKSNKLFNLVSLQ